MPHELDAAYLRSHLPGDEGMAVGEIDSMIRSLRVLKDAIQGKDRRHYDNGPPSLYVTGGMVNPTNLASAVVRLFQNLERLHFTTTESPCPHLGMLTKIDGEWRYFRSGPPDISGWRAIDGDERRDEA